MLLELQYVDWTLNSWHGVSDHGPTMSNMLKGRCLTKMMTYYSSKSLWLTASTEKKPTTPKNSSKNPVRRSTRLSPQVENKDEPHEASTKKRSPSSKTKSVLKPSENIPFTHNSRNFKMPVSKRQSKVHELKQAAKAKLFCPNKHSAEEICTGCMSR